MSALPSSSGETRLLPMLASDADAIHAIEQRCYTVPWTRGNFIDSIAAGHFARVLRDDAGTLLGYCLAMYGVDELHLLNITVAPEFQGRGHSLVMLDAICAEGRARGARELWLEVRVSNERARKVYADYGLHEVGQRRAYYPQPDGGREDAVLMSLALQEPEV